MSNAVLPKGSLILITGATGFIGANVRLSQSHYSGIDRSIDKTQTVQEALNAGYKVRGTTRSEERADYTRKVFKHDPNFSTAIIPDVSLDGAFDDAVKGVDAVIHMASDVSLNPDPNVVVKDTEAATRSILRSAAKVPSVRRFVLTSSSSAVLFPGPNVYVDEKTWNQQALDIAWAPPPYTMERAFPVYAASKVAGLFGSRILTSGGPTGSAPESLLNGTVPDFPPQYHIDVIDDARIHLIAAALDSSVKNERIFAFNVPFTWTEVISNLRELRPDSKTLAAPPKIENPDLSRVPNARGAELLKTWYQQNDGYKTVRQSLQEALDTL